MMERPRLLPLAAALVLAGAGCSEAPSSAAAPAPPPTASTTPSASVTGTVSLPPGPPPKDIFTDEAQALGIDFVRHYDSTLTCELDGIYWGVGCVLDYDGDGLQDLYFPDAEGYPNRLYHNEGKTFRDATEESGTGYLDDSGSCLPFDADGDGDLDLYLGNLGADRLLRNDGGVFTDVTEQYGIADDGPTTSVAAGDVDGDGDLDLFVGRLFDFSTCNVDCPPHLQNCTPIRSSLYINEGGKFVDETEARGIVVVEPTLTDAFVDIDLDGDLDLYVGHDLADVYQNRMFINDGTGRFVDRGEEIGLARDANGNGIDAMGVTMGDYDLDGVLDFAMTNFEAKPTILFHCTMPGPKCVDSRLEGHGIENTVPFLNWGIGLIDFDDDGWLDLFQANGGLQDKNSPKEHPVLTPERNQLFWNVFGHFVEYTPKEGEALADIAGHRGTSFADLDNDGDVDIVVGSNAGAPQVLVNHTSRGHALTVELDTLSAGAMVTVEAGARKRTQPVQAGGAYLGSDDPRLHFGLGSAKTARVEVQWLDGHVRTLTDVSADQILKVER